MNINSSNSRSSRNTQRPPVSARVSSKIVPSVPHTLHQPPAAAGGASRCTRPRPLPSNSNSDSVSFLLQRRSGERVDDAVRERSRSHRSESTHTALCGRRSDGGDAVGQTASACAGAKESHSGVCDASRVRADTVPAATAQTDSVSAEATRNNNSNNNNNANTNNNNKSVSYTMRSDESASVSAGTAEVEAVGKETEKPTGDEKREPPFCPTHHFITPHTSSASSPLHLSSETHGHRGVSECAAVPSVAESRPPRPHTLRTVTQHSTVTSLSPTLDVRDAHNQMHLSRNFLLPPLHPRDAGRVATVVLDLDETLCYNRGLSRAVLRPGALALVRHLRARYRAPRYTAAGRATRAASLTSGESLSWTWSSRSMHGFSSDCNSSNSATLPSRLSTSTSSFGGERLYANTLQARLFGTTSSSSSSPTSASPAKPVRQLSAPAGRCVAATTAVGDGNETELGTATGSVESCLCASSRASSESLPYTERNKSNENKDEDKDAEDDDEQGVLLELVLWTASVETVARRVVRALDPAGDMFDYTIYRDLRWYRSAGYTKDLRRLGRRMERVVIVENAPDSVLLNRGNAILVSDFVSNKDDRQLFVVQAVLQDWLGHVDAWLRSTPPPPAEPCTTVAHSASSSALSSLHEGETKRRSPSLCTPRSAAVVGEGEEEKSSRGSSTVPKAAALLPVMSRR